VIETAGRERFAPISDKENEREREIREKWGRKKKRVKREETANLLDVRRSEGGINRKKGFRRCKIYCRCATEKGGRRPLKRENEEAPLLVPRGGGKKEQLTTKSIKGKNEAQKGSSRGREAPKREEKAT